VSLGPPLRGTPDAATLVATRGGGEAVHTRARAVDAAGRVCACPRQLFPFHCCVALRLTPANDRWRLFFLGAPLCRGGSLGHPGRRTLRCCVRHSGGGRRRPVTGRGAPRLWAAWEACRGHTYFERPRVGVKVVASHGAGSIQLWRGRTRGRLVAIHARCKVGGEGVCGSGERGRHCAPPAGSPVAAPAGAARRRASELILVRGAPRRRVCRRGRGPVRTGGARRVVGGGRWVGGDARRRGCLIILVGGLRRTASL